MHLLKEHHLDASLQICSKCIHFSAPREFMANVKLSACKTPKLSVKIAVTFLQTFVTFNDSIKNRGLAFRAGNSERAETKADHSGYELINVEFRF